MSETDTGKAVEVLDLLLEFFGETGAHWTRGRYHDGHGRRCLIGALDYLRRKHRVSERGSGVFSARGNAPSEVCPCLFCSSRYLI